MEFTHLVMRGPGGLPPWQRELLATLTSRWNDCAFCMRSHAAATAVLMRDAGLADAEGTVAAVLADAARAPVPDADRLLYGAVEQWTANRGNLGQALTDGLLAAGWTTAQIFEASTVCALFCFFNAWVSGHGVADMTPEAYAASGERLARGNYRPA
jgi:uncharacterized peroxidase-related enzyme